MNQKTEQCASRNRDSVDNSSKVTWLQQDDRDSVTSLMILQCKIIDEGTASSDMSGLHHPDSNSRLY